MKKYIELKPGDRVVAGQDEFRFRNGSEWSEWKKCRDSPTLEPAHFGANEWQYRRQVPHTGRVQFLMEMSILATVIVDCDGKTQDEIEEEAAELATAKIFASPKDYVISENIMLSNSRVDDDELQPEQPASLATTNPIIQ